MIVASNKNIFNGCLLTHMLIKSIESDFAGAVILGIITGTTLI